ncbi:MAG: MFS transporter [Phycisphaerales bacterium]
MSSTAAAPGDTGAFLVRTRLSVMMFLQYAVWGIWLPVLAIYLGAKKEAGGLGFDGGQIGMILGLAGSVGAVAAPFIAGQVADRFLPAERALGILLVAGGVVNLLLANADSYGSFLLLSVLYSVAYMPTLSLSNSIAMSNLRNENVDFPRVRVWGTIGWIVASAVFPLVWLQTNHQFTALPWFLEGTPKPNATALIPDALRVSGYLSFAYAAYAFMMLPYTPPKGSSRNPLAFIEAFALLRYRGVLVLCVAAIIISMIHNVYFLRTGPWLTTVGFTSANAPAAMTVGQMVEIITLAALGWFISKLGFKSVLTIGALAYFLRFADFASTTADNRGLAYLGIALHGFCYAFFFAAAFLYIDRTAPRDARHSAQTAFGIAILGLGPVLAGVYNGFLDTVATAPAAGAAAPGGLAGWWQGALSSMGVSLTPGALSYPAVWWTEAAIGAAVFVLMLVAMPGVPPKPADE